MKCIDGIDYGGTMNNYEKYRAIGQKVLIKIAIHIDNSMSVAI